jgi:uncharacterized protein YjbJ (UPF0337 family)
MTDAAATTATEHPALPAADAIIAAIKNDFLDAINKLTAERNALKAKVTELEGNLDNARDAYDGAMAKFKAEVQTFVDKAKAERDTLVAQIADLTSKLGAAGVAVATGVENMTVEIYKDTEEEAAALKAKIAAGLDNLRAHAGRLADITLQPVRTGVVGLSRALNGVGTYIASHL